MGKQLAFQFGDAPPDKRKRVPILAVVPPLSVDKINRQRIKNAKKLNVNYPQITVPEDFYQEIEPHLTCNGCQFSMQPKLHYVMVSGEQFLCLNCFENLIGIEHFTVDLWLEAHGDETEWRMEVVEKYMAV